MAEAHPGSQMGGSSPQNMMLAVSFGNPATAG